MAVEAIESVTEAEEVALEEVVDKESPQEEEQTAENKEDDEEDDDEEEDEEEEEEEDPIDPFETAREDCAKTTECSNIMKRFEQCEERVNSRAHTEENCSEEILDFFHCQDSCASKGLMKKLK